MKVAVDGPAGAGKSTLARQVAAELGFIYVDTGALYRAVALHIIENEIGISVPEAVLDELPRINIELKFIGGQQRVLINGRDVSDLIRTPGISMGASDVSAIPGVRAFLLDLQRDIAAKNNVIMDGRDIGTVILPDAELKIFLTASAGERAMRRYNELRAKGGDDTLEEITEDMKKRDFNDTNRASAPLAAAPDAIVIDSTGMTADEVAERIIGLIQNNKRDADPFCSRVGKIK